MSGSRDLEGVHGPINALDLTWSEPGCQIAQISAERRGAATGDEVFSRELLRCYLVVLCMAPFAGPRRSCVRFARS